MRKLIIVGTISVVAMIAWIGYLKYDTQQFIKELPELPSSEQQSGGIPGEVDSLRDVDEATTPSTITDVKNENDPSAAPPHTVQTDDSVISTGTTNSEEGVVTQTLEDNSAELTPEIKTLFVRYKNLFDQYRKVSRELQPLMKQATELTLQLQKDPPPKVKQEIIKQIEELDTYIIPL